MKYFKEIFSKLLRDKPAFLSYVRAWNYFDIRKSARINHGFLVSNTGKQFLPRQYFYSTLSVPILSHSPLSICSYHLHTF